eukprot:gene5304-3807_t
MTYNYQNIIIITCFFNMIAIRSCWSIKVVFPFYSVSLLRQRVIFETELRRQSDHFEARLQAMSRELADREADCRNLQSVVTILGKKVDSLSEQRTSSRHPSTNRPKDKSRECWETAFSISVFCAIGIMLVPSVFRRTGLRLQAEKVSVTPSEANFAENLGILKNIAVRGLRAFGVLSLGLVSLYYVRKRKLSNNAVKRPEVDATYQGMLIRWLTWIGDRRLPLLQRNTMRKERKTWTIIMASPRCRVSDDTEELRLD